MHTCPAKFNSDTVSVHFNHFYSTDLRQTKEGLSLDISPSKGLNSKFLSIMLILNKMCFLDMLLMAM